MSSVLDASALLAYLRREPGAAVVEQALNHGAVMNTVNYAEVLSRLSDLVADVDREYQRHLRTGLIGGLLVIVALIEEDAVTVARLRAATRRLRLSVGDRACLATGLRLGWPVLTADTAWSGLSVGVTIQQIRP